VGAKFPLGLVEDFGADDIRGQQIDRELDPAELHVDRLGEAIDEQRLGQTGHALQEQVATGEKGDEQSLYHNILTDDDLGNALTNSLNKTEGRGGLHHEIKFDLPGGNLPESPPA
jgi:hypothetical protein